MNTYQEFISKSRYSRYLEEKQRREHWPETAVRWINFFKKTLEKKFPEKIREHSMIWTAIQNAITNLDVLPSMRSIMTAGPALERTNVAAYNCSYLPVDDWRSFDEAMYILLCGTGVGFSVEEKYVSKLPDVPSKIEDRREIVIVVEDSKEGWCHAYRELLGGRQKQTWIT